MQIDVEMSFAGSEDVMMVVESLIKNIWNMVFLGSVQDRPFMRMTYDDAMSKVFALAIELIKVWE
jgi:aspartyl-tRNA synthetase